MYLGALEGDVFLVTSVSALQGTSAEIVTRTFWHKYDGENCLAWSFGAPDRETSARCLERSVVARLQSDHSRKCFVLLLSFAVL